MNLGRWTAWDPKSKQDWNSRMWGILYEFVSEKTPKYFVAELISPPVHVIIIMDMAKYINSNFLMTDVMKKWFSFKFGQKYSTLCGTLSLLDYKECEVMTEPCNSQARIRIAFKSYKNYQDVMDFLTIMPKVRFPQKSWDIKIKMVWITCMIWIYINLAVFSLFQIKDL